jgi:DNA-binding response OmpR family regulator
LAQLLEQEQYEIAAPTEFTNAAALVLAVAPDLVLLDLGLPGTDGFQICRAIRRQSEVPILVVTSRNTETDELMSMHLGADDFITKPYSPQVLLARVEAALRRAYGYSGRALQAGGAALRLDSGQLEYQGNVLELTKNEQRILQTLMRCPGKIHTRESLMEALWQTDAFVDDNTLTVNINRLRRKLAEIGLEGFVKTRRGQGYLI